MSDEQNPTVTITCDKQVLSRWGYVCVGFSSGITVGFFSPVGYVHFPLTQQTVFTTHNQLNGHQT